MLVSSLCSISFASRALRCSLSLFIIALLYSTCICLMLDCSCSMVSSRIAISSRKSSFLRSISLPCVSLLNCHRYYFRGSLFNALWLSLKRRNSPFLLREPCFFKKMLFCLFFYMIMRIFCFFALPSFCQKWQKRLFTAAN